MFLFIQHEAEASLNFHLLIMCLRFYRQNTLGLELFGGFLSKGLSPFLFSVFLILNSCLRAAVEERQ